MGQQIPQEIFGKLVPWMIRLLNVDDREGVMRMWSVAIPAPAFDMIKGLVKAALKDNEWDDLTHRFPEIA
jgi:hypothetical protein